MGMIRALLMLLFAGLVVSVSTTAVLALGAYSAFAGGFVMSQIWAWFAVPLGAHPASWPTFAAAVVFLNLLRPQATPPAAGKKQDTSAIVATAIGALAAPWFALLLAWWLK